MVEDHGDWFVVADCSCVVSLALKALQVGQIVSQPSITDPTEGNLPTFETESLPFAQEFYGVIEPSYGR